MTMPNLQPEDPREVMRRRLLAQMGDPNAVGRPRDFLPPSPPEGQYTLGEIGNANVNRDPAQHPVRNLILSALDGGLRGLQAGNDPQANGASGFLGALGQGYAATRDDQERQQRQAMLDRIAAQSAGDESRLRQSEADYYNAGIPLRGAQTQNALTPKTAPPPKFRAGDMLPNADGTYSYIQPTNQAPVIPKAASNAPAPVPHALAEYTRQLAAVRRETVPSAMGLTKRPKYPDAASQQAEAVARTQAVYPSFKAPGGSGSPPPITRPQRQGGSSKLSAADRWDALTGQGMSSDSATAQVHRELAAGQVTP